jgi:pimeloyl-ACP methyl ester carboxylesterase
VHLHGFGMSGAYLVPTAKRLAGEFHTFVPDLPGFGHSGNSALPLDVTDLAHTADRSSTTAASSRRRWWATRRAAR